MNWTNQSVLAFAGDEEPITAIEKCARSAILGAMDRGWTGPPFDPIKLADILNLRVEARADVGDARTVVDADGQPLIQFNPTRPRGRARFSIAHEIAHTFFPDCLDRVRHRYHEHGSKGDNWQLEMLCNIAAAEIIMPIGSFSKLSGEDLDVDNLIALQHEYGVSSEAILIRAIKLTHKPAVMFVASRINGKLPTNQFRIDYSISSSTWPGGSLTGMNLGADSVLGECTAVGYTARSVERLPGLRGKHVVQCVGLPAYPGSSFPRIGGIVSPGREGAPKSFEIKRVYGDATKPGGRGPQVIAHIVNDKTPNWGGGGFAIALRRRMPQIQDEFKGWARQSPENLRLGNVHHCEVDKTLSIVSMIAQKGYGPSPTPRVRYWALSGCLENLSAIAESHRASIHMPLIGTGNAGGSWDIIEELIMGHLVERGLKVTVYQLQPNYKGLPLDDLLSRSG